MANESSAFPRWAVLLKFGQNEHLETFRNEGLIYANHLEYFSSLERSTDQLRFDRFEGSSRIVQPSNIGEITFEDKSNGRRISAKASDLAGPVIISLNKESDCNVFCTYGITQPTKHPAVDIRNLKFGDSFVLILNTQEFFDRVQRAASARDIECEYRPVEYYDCERYTGDTGPFKKPHEFAFQREFRIVFRPGVKFPLHLRIGDITDITTPVHDLAQINEMLEFDEESAREAGVLAA